MTAEQKELYTKKVENTTKNLNMILQMHKDSNGNPIFEGWEIKRVNQGGFVVTYPTIKEDKQNAISPYIQVYCRYDMEEFNLEEMASTRKLTYDVNLSALGSFQINKDSNLLRYYEAHTRYITKAEHTLIIQTFAKFLSWCDFCL